MLQTNKRFSELLTKLLKVAQKHLNVGKKLHRILKMFQCCYDINYNRALLHSLKKKKFMTTITFQTDLYKQTNF